MRIWITAGAAADTSVTLGYTCAKRARHDSTAQLMELDGSDTHPTAD